MSGLKVKHDALQQILTCSTQLALCCFSNHLNLSQNSKYRASAAHKPAEEQSTTPLFFTIIAEHTIQFLDFIFLLAYQNLALVPNQHVKICHIEPNKGKDSTNSTPL